MAQTLAVGRVLINVMRFLTDTEFDIIAFFIWDFGLVFFSEVFFIE